MAIYYKARGSVFYTVVGSPTIVDGVVSGITNARDYVRTTAILPSVINSFEGCFKVKRGSAGGFCIMYSHKSGFSQYYAFALNYAVKESTSYTAFWRYKPATSNPGEIGRVSVPLRGTNGTLAQEWYWIKITMGPGSETGKFVYSYYDSTDGENWDLLASKEDTYQMTGDDLSLLDFVSNPNNSAGSTSNIVNEIDLNHTYIKINNKLWFGRQQAKTVTCNATTVWRAQ